MDSIKLKLLNPPWVLGEIITYKGGRAVIYIPDLGSLAKPILDNKVKCTRKYHFVYCETVLQHAVKDNLARFTTKTNKTDYFNLYGNSNGIFCDSRKKLKVCLNCLKASNYKNYNSSDSGDKRLIADNFSVRLFLENNAGSPKAAIHLTSPSPSVVPVITARGERPMCLGVIKGGALDGSQSQFADLLIFANSLDVLVEKPITRNSAGSTSEIHLKKTRSPVTNIDLSANAIKQQSEKERAEKKQLEKARVEKARADRAQIEMAQAEREHRVQLEKARAERARIEKEEADKNTKPSSKRVAAKSARWLFASAGALMLFLFVLMQAYIPASLLTSKTPQKLKESLKVSMPAIGKNELYSRPQIRYCLAEQIRLDAAEKIINDHNQSQLIYFNNFINDYNLRCVEYTFSHGALAMAKEEVEKHRMQLESEGRERFGNNGEANAQVTVFSKSKPISSIPPILPLPPNTMSAEVIVTVQRQLNYLGYNAGPEDGLYGNETRIAVETFQRNIGIAVTGIVDSSFLQSLVNR